MKLISTDKVIKTNRMLLVNSNIDILEKVLSHDTALGEFLDVDIPDSWTEFGSAPFQYALDQIKDHPTNAVWWSWLPVLVSGNVLVGNCGYKGPPRDGMVEIGYEVAPMYRGQGLATEIATALIENAFAHDRVTIVQAHTLAEENASVHILRKCGFEFVEEIVDPEDGVIWKWVLKK